MFEPYIKHCFFMEVMKMLLQDEQYVVKWLSQYGALPKTQIIKMLRKPPQTAEKILRNLKKQMQISDVGGGYYVALDSMCQPDQRTILAVWVLLKFIDYVDPMAHYPAVYPSQKKGHSMEFLREIAHLRPRTNTFGAVFRIRHHMAYAIHKFFHDRGFFYFHTPIITASDCEGAGQMFQVTTLNLYDLKKDEKGSILYDDDFFGKQASLTVSGQLEGELAATALGQIYTFGPTFRAENSNTPRHLAEFWMIEPEVAFNDITDNMELAEEFIKYCVRWALENCMDDVKFLNDMFDKELIARLEGVLKDSFVRLSYTEGIKILEEAVANGRKFEFPVYWGVDLAAEHERFLVEEHFKRPVILTDYPKEIKAFYMKQNEDGKTVRAMDVLFPKIGEIIGGSEREADYDKLLSRIEELHIPMKDMWWYLDTRRFGTVPHSGFGLGFERLLLFVTGMSNIRDVIPFPRTPNNAEF